MRPSLRLHLIIIIASLIPSLAVVWHRIDQRAERAADAELAVALAVLHTRYLRSPDACNVWLRHHASHPLAEQLRLIVQPDLSGQITGSSHRSEALARMLGGTAAAE